MDGERMFPPRRKDWIDKGRGLQVGIFVRMPSGGTIEFCSDNFDVDHKAHEHIAAALAYGIGIDLDKIKAQIAAREK